MRYLADKPILHRTNNRATFNQPAPGELLNYKPMGVIISLIAATTYTANIPGNTRLFDGFTFICFELSRSVCLIPNYKHRVYSCCNWFFLLMNVLYVYLTLDAREILQSLSTYLIIEQTLMDEIRELSEKLREF